MNLLVLSTWCPYPPDNGSRLRAFHLIRGLAARHRVRLVAGLQEDVAADVGDGVPEPLRALCDDVELVPWRWYAGDSGGAWRSLLSLTPRSIAEMENPALRAAIARQLVKPTDAVLVLQQGIAPLVPTSTPPAVLEEVEVTGPERTWRSARGMARCRYGLALWKANRYWRHAMRRYQAVTAVSEEEAEAVRRVLGASAAGTPPVSVVPNGVDVSAYRRAPGRVVPGRLIYNGSLSYAPNLDAVRWFAEEILPRIAAEVPEAHLVVTGRDDGLAIDDLRANPRIHLTGFLPDLRPALDEAALCVVPLRAGGGTRLKVLEAWAAELPVVSTTLGAAGLGARDGENVALADTPEAFASAVVRLLGEPDPAKMLAQQARCVVEQAYDWDAIAERLSNLLCAVAAAKRERAVS